MIKRPAWLNIDQNIQVQIKQSIGQNCVADELISSLLHQVYKEKKTYSCSFDGVLMLNIRIYHAYEIKDKYFQFCTTLIVDFSFLFLPSRSARLKFMSLFFYVFRGNFTCVVDKELTLLFSFPQNVWSNYSKTVSNFSFLR